MLSEIVVKPAKPFVFKKGDRVKEMYGDERSAIVIDRVEDFVQVKKDPKGVDIGWIYQDEDQVTKPWYLVKYTKHDDREDSNAFGWEPQDELELDVDDLQEIVVKPQTKFFFRKGDRVYGEKTKAVLLVTGVYDNYEQAVAANPKEKGWADQFVQHKPPGQADPSAPWYQVGSKSKNGNYLVNRTIVPEGVLKVWGGYA